MEIQPSKISSHLFLRTRESSFQKLPRPAVPPHDLTLCVPWTTAAVAAKPTPVETPRSDVTKNLLPRERQCPGQTAGAGLSLLHSCYCRCRATDGRCPALRVPWEVLLSGATSPPPRRGGAYDTHSPAAAAVGTAVTPGRHRGPAAAATSRGDDTPARWGFITAFYYRGASGRRPWRREQEEEDRHPHGHAPAAAARRPRPQPAPPLPEGRPRPQRRGRTPTEAEPGRARRAGHVTAGRGALWGPCPRRAGHGNYSSQNRPRRLTALTAQGVSRNVRFKTQRENRRTATFWSFSQLAPCSPAFACAISCL
ncbi:uncharacterized protein LOC135410676 [Pseudopipra pipra]|uniref:uncharacterized protein LOC135410676 n=1 Tax=Pseudopipra pipra TaxID=415032 RepID=UPI003139D467